jgi:hypothetical protein
MKPTVSLREALTDPALLGTILTGVSWRPWRVVLIAAMGEQLLPDERELFRKLTGRDSEAAERVDELWGVIGRRGGKTRAGATLAAYIAALCDHRTNVAPGERPLVLFIAQNQRQAAVAFNYCAGIFDSVPLLSGLVTSRTSDTLSLSCGVDLEVRAASFRGIRGVTAVAVIADEAAFWYSDESANADSEILNAVRPTLATTGGPLVVISSPHAQSGEVYSTYRSHFGPQGDRRILVVQGASRDFNPALPQAVVDRAIERDAAAASAEYLGQFRSDLVAFVDRAVVDAAVDPGVHERPPIEGVRYFGFVDPSGGGSDSMTLGIAHLEGRVLVLDAVRERRPPFSPEAVVAEFADLLNRYRVMQVVGDRYGGEWPRERFAQHGINYAVAQKTRSDLYLALLPELNSKRVALLDNSRLVSQLCGLERRTARGGRDIIDHGPGRHDDLANAVAGTLWLARPPAEMNVEIAAPVSGNLLEGAPHLGGPGFGDGLTYNAGLSLHSFGPDPEFPVHVGRL